MTSHQVSPESRPATPVRPAAAVNEEIRALWLRGPGHLTGERRQHYEELVAEWAAAVRAEVVTAA
ncbi:hypothetical protein [Streptomyces sp. NPDC060194]|uniref:hypothetical protein n=1 Tax=Streptomyces sp. NPDC060194 TaxID=3347069 RepID=UPI00365D24B0